MKRRATRGALSSSLCCSPRQAHCGSAAVWAQHLLRRPRNRKWNSRHRWRWFRKGALCCPQQLAASLSDRESRLAVQEAALNDRIAALALADETITQRLAELQAAEEQLRSTLALADGAAEEDIARLVAVYETMKPKDAARLFDAMDC